MVGAGKGDGVGVIVVVGDAGGDNIEDPKSSPCCNPEADAGSGDLSPSSTSPNAVRVERVSDDNVALLDWPPSSG